MSEEIERLIEETEARHHAGELSALTLREALECAYDFGRLGDKAEGGWQPIETAPTDGTHVVLFGTLWGDPNQTPRACVSWYCRTRTDGPVHCLGWFFSAPGYSNGFSPTHWSPLPEGKAGTPLRGWFQSTPSREVID